MASRRVPRLMPSRSDSSVSTICDSGGICPLVMAVRNETSACSRRLVLVRPVSEAVMVKAILRFRRRVVDRCLSTTVRERAAGTVPRGSGRDEPEDALHDPVGGQAVAVVQGGQRAGVEELVGEGDGLDPPPDAGPGGG